jgi:hypothetical protein
MEKSHSSLNQLKSYYLVPEHLLLDSDVRDFSRETARKITKNLRVANKRAALASAVSKQENADQYSQTKFDHTQAKLDRILSPSFIHGTDQVKTGAKRGWDADGVLSLAKRFRAQKLLARGTKEIRRKNPYLALRRVLEENEERHRDTAVQTLPLNPRPFMRRQQSIDAETQLNETEFPEYLLEGHMSTQTPPIEPPPLYPTLVDLLPKRHRVDGHILLEHMQTVIESNTDKDEDRMLQLVYYLVTEGSEPPPYWMGEYLKLLIRDPDFPKDSVASKKRGYLTDEYLSGGISREKTKLRSRLTKAFH